MALGRGLYGVARTIGPLRTPRIAVLTQRCRFFQSYASWAATNLHRTRWTQSWHRRFSTPKNDCSGSREAIAREQSGGGAAVAEGAVNHDQMAGSHTAASSGDHTAATDGKHEKDQCDTERDDADKQTDAVSIMPLGIFGCASLVLVGYLFSHLREKSEGDVKVSTMLERCWDYMVEVATSMFPQEEGPLLPDVSQLNYPPNLPTLVVDLDKVVAKLEYNRRTGWQVKKRPYADRFFRELINYYEIVLWSDDAYPMATDVANRWGLPVVGCLHRDRCTKFQGSYIKDLSKLGRDLRRVVMLDHDRGACTLQEENAILVREFDGDENDRELLHLIGLLKTIAVNPQDVKAQLRQLGGGLDPDLGRRFAEKNQQDSERAKSRQSLSKLLGFKHY